MLDKMLYLIYSAFVRRSNVAWLIIIAALFAGTMAHAQPLNYDAFAALPIQHEGRIKPLQTFAMTHLQEIAGTTKIDDQNAIEWLASVMFSPLEAIERPIFLLKDADARAMLELPAMPHHRYRFIDIMQAIGSHQSLISSLLERPSHELSLGQRAVVKLYGDSGLFRQIMLSATLILPNNTALSPAEMKRLQLNATEPVFTDYFRALPLLQREVRRIIAANGPDPKRYSLSQQQIVNVARNLIVALETSRDNSLLRVVPTEWNDTQEWLSPWAVFHAGKGSPATAWQMDQWRRMAAAYRTNNAQEWHVASSDLAARMHRAMAVKPDLLMLEIAYYQWAPLAKALLFYVIGFAATLLVMVATTAWFRRLRIVSIAMVSMAALFHALSIVVRVIILHRPPVATLYESLLFVSIIAVLFGLFLEYRMRNTVGLLVAALSGSLLLLASEGFGSGDTMSMLMAVLNTNFWLATHVLCITTGYGFALVAGMLAHGYLVVACRHPSAESVRILFASAYATALIALLFTTIGTILGGIWADQSWGRFWGWDPKENGALMICLWIIWLLHGRMAGQIHSRGVAAGLVVLNVVVACSWLGVNLLATGLHSYGFTDKAAWGLAAFCALEIGFAATTYYMLWRRERAA